MCVCVRFVRRCNTIHTKKRTTHRNSKMPCHAVRPKSGRYWLEDRLDWKQQLLCNMNETNRRVERAQATIWYESCRGKERQRVREMGRNSIWLPLGMRENNSMSSFCSLFWRCSDFWHLNAGRAVAGNHLARFTIVFVCASYQISVWCVIVVVVHVDRVSTIMWIILHILLFRVSREIAADLFVVSHGCLVAILLTNRPKKAFRALGITFASRPYQETNVPMNAECMTRSICQSCSSNSTTFVLSACPWIISMSKSLRITFGAVGKLCKTLRPVCCVSMGFIAKVADVKTNADFPFSARARSLLMLI